MPLPAWIAAALAHPEVRKVGMQAVTKAGSMVSERIASRKTPPVEAQEEPENEVAALREAFEALPTRHELAEAVAALDEQAAERTRQTRRLIIGGIAIQTVILGALILAF